ncbi:hypothetical protein BOTBODRAFT_30922 [Botryobasidium botryosum FD-172 SS1]|uniref:Uncharacterized protein n=1 Tax=Botryobasidium botryosum (strain FD-172 SS1) TaxID=930990 RepID=A0A067MK99_BOTB1|nr:hypothetical protein BOTBODRAFT_30922 [Botryobasidium botryosum FD-172 SS1]
MATITPEYVNAQRRARILASKASSDPGRASMSISTTSVAPSDFSSVLNISHSPKSTPPTSPIFPITPGSAPRPHHPPKDRKNRKGVVFTSDNDSLRIRRNSGASVDVSVGAHELADVLNEQIGNWLSMEEEEESDDSPPSPVASSYLSAETTSLDGDSIYSEASDAYSGRDIMFASYAKSAPLILMMPKARGSPPTPPPQITRSSRLSAVPPLPPPVTPLPPTPQGLPPTPNSSAPRRPSFSRSPSQFANHASTQSTLPLRSPPFPAPPNSRLFPETPGHSELDLSALHIDPYPPPSPSREHRGQHIPSSELVALSRALQEERLALERSHAAERALLERRVQALQEEARQREMRVKELMWLFEHPTQPGVMMSPDDDEDLDPEPPRGRSLSRRSSVTSRS